MMQYMCLSGRSIPYIIYKVLHALRQGQISNNNNDASNNNIDENNNNNNKSNKILRIIDGIERRRSSGGIE